MASPARSTSAPVIEAEALANSVADAARTCGVKRYFTIPGRDPFGWQLQPVPLRLGRPTWGAAPDLDPAWHVVRRTLADPAGFDDLVAELAGGVPLPRDRPLWRLWVVDGLAEPGFGQRFIGSRLGATTHISVLDADGRACAVTCTNGEGSGVVIPGTGIHVNNIMGEEDLSPLGFHHAPAGRRMPSMMSPTAVLRGGELHLALGSSGSNRIRSALLQTIVGVVDHYQQRFAIDFSYGEKRRLVMFLESL